MLHPLRRYRIDAVLTVDELADRSGVPAATIRNIETRRVGCPRVSTLGRLAEELGVRASELVEAADPVVA
jgi:transcriptional regulator with XRE-family HTH domain